MSTACILKKTAKPPHFLQPKDGFRSFFKPCAKKLHYPKNYASQAPPGGAASNAHNIELATLKVAFYAFPMVF